MVYCAGTFAVNHDFAAVDIEEVQPDATRTYGKDESIW
jgi:hypothetical protein